MTCVLDPPGGEAVTLGPVDAGEVPFVLVGEKFAVDVPADGRLVCSWARDGAWMRLVPWGLAPWCRADFARLLTDPAGPVDLSVCHKIVMELSADVFGVPWWTAGRVAMAISDHWDRYAGWCATRGFDPTQACAHRVIGAGLGWLRSGVSEEKDAKKLESQLFAPPKEVRRSRRRGSGLRPEDQAAAWRAAKAAWGSGSG